MNTSHRNGHLPARRMIALAAERVAPKMHWRWRRRGRDIESLLRSRFGSTLPEDDAGMDAVRLLAQHYGRLNLNAERVVRANLRLLAPWLTVQETNSLVVTAMAAKTPSASKLGREFRVTSTEVADLHLETILPYPETLKRDRVRQARRRRNAGAGTKRGRPRSEGLRPWQVAGISRATWFRRRKASETEIRHAPSYIRGMRRDEFKSHAVSMSEVFDFALFGIIALEVTRDRSLIASWRTA
jgi:hypothetical protein